MTFDELRKANIARAKLWHPGKSPGLLFRAVELGGEAGELLNEIKHLHRYEQKMPGGRNNLWAIAKELADVIITADLLAEDLAINLDDAVRTKFNLTSDQRGFSTRL